MKRYLIMLAGLAIILTACNTKEKITPEQKKVLDKDAVGAYAVKMGTVVFEYSEEGCQLAVSREAGTSRVQLDDQSKLLQLKFSAEPAKDKDITVDIVARGISNLVNTTGAKMKVLKIADDKIWLFYADKNLGFVMPY